MFSDPLVAVMTVLLLFFAGSVLMFLFLTRTLSAMREDFHETMRKQQIFLVDLEQQLMQISFSVRSLQGGEKAATAGSSLSKNFGELPLLRQEDPLLSMLEANAKKNSTPPGFDDQLLPPIQNNSPFKGAYDPAEDAHLFEDAFLPGPGGGRADRVKRSR